MRSRQSLLAQNFRDGFAPIGGCQKVDNPIHIEARGIITQHEGIAMNEGIMPVADFHKER